MIPKFRAWDKKTDTMHSVIAIWFGGESHVTVPSGDSVTVIFDNFELMQSTGLKDRNGVEIFEGDICIQRGEEPYSDENMTLDEDWEYRGIIKFQDFAYWLQDNEGFLKWLGTDCDEIEVIGNIYKNPELLNER